LVQKRLDNWVTNTTQRLTNLANQLQRAMDKNSMYARRIGEEGPVAELDLSLRNLSLQLKSQRRSLGPLRAQIREALARGQRQQARQLYQQLLDTQAQVQETITQQIEARRNRKMAIADLGYQRLEVQQQLAHTYDTKAGGVARAQYITDKEIPILQQQLTTLEKEREKAVRAHNKRLAQEIADAIAYKQFEIESKQLEAQEQIAQNTANILQKIAAPLSFEFGGQTFTDLVGAGTGV
jgi:hypothetical protein